MVESESLLQGISGESGRATPTASALFVAVRDYEDSTAYHALPRAAEAAAELSRALERSGFDCAHPEALKGGRSSEVRDIVRSWSQRARGDTRLLLYWTGHGKREDQLYLVTQESPARNLDAGTAMEAGSLAKILASTDATKVLIVLDVCFAGEALSEMAGRIANILASQYPDPRKRRGIAIIASAHALQSAQEGLLCRTLSDVLLKPGVARRWSDSDEYIDSDRLSDALADLLEASGSDQIIAPGGVGHKSEIIPNPRYRAELVAQDVETRRRRLLEEGEDHFERSSRGIEVDETGWYFSGRQLLLAELVSWLDGAGSGLVVVTGPPGAGKSAVLGRLAILSDPVLRKTAEKLGGIGNASATTIPREGSIDVAVHAKGKTLDDCARAIAAKLELNAGAAIDAEALVEALAPEKQRVSILIDALDEAGGRQGERIARELVAPLSRLRNVKLLVGTRRSLDGAMIPQGEDRHGRLRRVFGEAATIYDLEDEPQTEADIGAYVRQRLLDSRHKSNLQGIDEAAHTIARKADGIFLYARVVTRTLQEQNRLDVGNLPATALSAFVDDLRKRFGAEETRVDELLAALAWTEGKGLTRRVWPVIATALSQNKRAYTDNDVSWVLDHAGWHIVETGEDGQTVYRLVHQAFTEYYRSNIDTRQANSSIVAAMTESIQGASWLDVDRYLWRYFSDHAADADRLSSFVKDPGYLAVADPTRLLPALSTITDLEACRYANIYRRTVDRLYELTPVERMPYIHLVAQMEEPELAAALDPPVPTRWRCRWARCRPTAPHRIIGKHDGKVNSVALSEIDGRTVIVSGGDDKTVRIWDAVTSKPIGAPLRDRKSITSVAFTKINSEVVVISGSESGIHPWNPLTGVRVEPWLDRGSKYFSRTAFVNGNCGQAVVIEDDKTIRIWEVATSKSIVGPLKRQDVASAALGTVDGRVVVALLSKDGNLQLQDVSTGGVVSSQLDVQGETTTLLSLFGFDGRVVVAMALGYRAKIVQLWDGSTGQRIGRSLEGHDFWVNALALGKVEGRLVAVSGSADKTLRLWDVITGEPIGPALKGHGDIVNSVAIGEVGGRPVVVSGSDDKTVRVWEMPLSGEAVERLAGHAGWVTAVATGQINDSLIIVSGGSDCTIWRWDASTGNPIDNPLLGHRRDITSVALGKIGRRTIIVSSCCDGAIKVWDASTGGPLGEAQIMHGAWVNSVAVGEVNGRIVVVAGDDDHNILLWDISTGCQIGQPFKGHKRPVTSVALGEIEGRSIVVSGSRDRTVRLWDASTGEPLSELLPRAGDWIKSVAIGKVGNDALIASGCTDKIVRVWNTSTGRSVTGALVAHDDEVSSVTFNANCIASVDVGGGLNVRWGPELIAGEAVQLFERLNSIVLLGKRSVAVAMARGVARIDFEECEDAKDVDF